MSLFSILNREAIWIHFALNRASDILVISKQNWSMLAKFAKKKIQRNRLFFTDCFLAKFPPEISSEIGQIFEEFAPKILPNLTFFR